MKIQINKYKKADGTIPNYWDQALSNQQQNPLIDKIIFNSFYKKGFEQYDEEFTQSDNLNIHKRSDFTITLSLQQTERSSLGLRLDDFLKDTAKFVCAIDFDTLSGDEGKQLTGIINLDTVYIDYDTLEVQFNCVDWVVEFANYCKSIGVMQTDFVPTTTPITPDSFLHKSFSEFISKQFRGNSQYGAIPFHFVGVTNNLQLDRAFGTDPKISSPLLWDILNRNSFISRWEMFTEIMKGLGASYRLNRVQFDNPSWFGSSLELFFKMDDNTISTVELLRANYKSGLSLLGTKNWFAAITEIANYTDPLGNNNYTNHTENRGIVFNKNIYAIINDNLLKANVDVKTEPEEFINNKFYWWSTISNVFYVTLIPPKPGQTTYSYLQSDVFDIGLKIYKSHIIEQYFSDPNIKTSAICDIAWVRILVQDFAVGTDGAAVNLYNDSNFMKLLQTFTMPNYMYYVIGVKEVLNWKVRFPYDSNLAIFNTVVKQDNKKKYFVNQIRNINLQKFECEVELIEK